MPAYPLRAAFAGTLLFIIGLALAIGALQVNRKEQEQLSGWRRVDGTVIELLRRPSAEGEVVVPLIAFTTAAGERISFTLNTVRQGPPYYVTAPVKILYHPDHPQDALIDTSARRWTRNVLAGGGALLLLALGSYVAWYASRWEKKSV